MLQVWACADGAQFSVPSALVNAPAHTNRTVVLLFVPSLTARQRIFFSFLPGNSYPPRNWLLDSAANALTNCAFQHPATASMLNPPFETAKEEGRHRSYTDVCSLWMSQAKSENRTDSGGPNVPRLIIIISHIW